MTIHQEIKRSGPENSLLTLQERAICEQIAVREAPHSQRALALLALDEGITQAQAGERAGLSKGQVKYWVAKFRKQRLDIFPDGLLDEPGAKETGVEPATEIEEKPEAIAEKADFVEDKTKNKKAKGKKGKRKAKKTKKSKGTKKSKKKTGKAKKKKAKKVKKPKK